MYFDSRTDPYWYYNNSLYNYTAKRIGGRMEGGVITESKKMLDKMKSNNIDDLEEVKRRYEKTLEKGIKDNYDNEDEYNKDIEYIKNMIDKLNDRIDKLNVEEEEEDEELMNDYNDYLKRFDDLDKDEVLDMKQIIDELYGFNKITDEKYNELMDKLIDRDIKIEGIKPVEREKILPEFSDEIDYTIKKDDDNEYKLTLNKGSNNDVLNESIDLFEDNIDDIIEAKGIEYVRSKFNIIIGEINEDNLINNNTVFKKANNYEGGLYNTSNPECEYYTDKLINRYEYFKYLNKENNGYDKNNKTKLDYFLFDYITENVAYEIKTLTKTYNEYKNIGFINLVSNKITGDTGEYKPLYTNDNKIKNIVVESKNTNFDCLKTSNLDYVVIFCLKDGNYKYEPLKDANFKIDSKTSRGKLLYDKYYDDYKIPINKLIKIN